jgi:general secretion pathway protein J
MTNPITPPRANGFTLIELMVALFVFGLLASAGLVLLRSSADGQAVLSERLGDNGRIVRASTLLRNELAQALPSGGRYAAFVSGGGALFAFTRAGQSGVDGTPPMRVRYSFDGGALKRQVADGEAATVMAELSAATAEFRDDAGQWQNGWTATTPNALPRAVRLSLTAKDGTVTHIIAMVGPQFRPVTTPAPITELGGGA